MTECSRCEPLLLDLAYGELPDAARDEVRAHVDGCASCGAAFARIQEGLQLAQALPIDEPSPEVAKRLTALAENEAAALAAPAPAPVRVRTWLEALRRGLSSPQLAMGTLTVLVLVVGLWLVPELRRDPDVAGGPVARPNAVHTGEGLQPAEPLDLEMDRRGRIRAKGEGEPEVAAAPTAAPAATRAENEQDEDLAFLPEVEGLEEKQAAQEPALGDADDELALAMREAERRAGGAVAAKPKKAASAKDDDALSGLTDQAVASRARPAATKKRSVPPPGDLLRNAYRDGPSAAPAAEPLPSPGAFAPPPPGRAPSAPAAESSSSGSAIRPPSGCERETSRARSLSASAPQAKTTGEAMIAVARCHIARGQRSAARPWLEKAAQIEATATQARSELRALGK